VDFDLGAAAVVGSIAEKAAEEPVDPEHAGVVAAIVVDIAEQNW
jgi:hypothetical protein